MEITLSPEIANFTSDLLNKSSNAYLMLKKTVKENLEMSITENTAIEEISFENGSVIAV